MWFHGYMCQQRRHVVLVIPDPKEDFNQRAPDTSGVPCFGEPPKRGCFSRGPFWDCPAFCDAPTLWTRSVSHHLRNPGMMRFPCKYQRTLWFQPRVSFRGAKWISISSIHSMSLSKRFLWFSTKPQTPGFEPSSSSASCVFLGVG